MATRAGPRYWRVSTELEVIARSMDYEELGTSRRLAHAHAGRIGRWEYLVEDVRGHRSH